MTVQLYFVIISVWLGRNLGLIVVWVIPLHLLAHMAQQQLTNWGPLTGCVKMTWISLVMIKQLQRNEFHCIRNCFAHYAYIDDTVVSLNQATDFMDSINQNKKPRWKETWLTSHSPLVAVYPHFRKYLLHLMIKASICLNNLEERQMKVFNKQIIPSHFQETKKRTVEPNHPSSLTFINLNIRAQVAQRPTTTL